ncbi:MAG: hypothetical protein JST40_13355 [Armatimonadetes bacterium]|nr:hypothetical protein [Armatimonadota bacterium]
MPDYNLHMILNWVGILRWLCYQSEVYATHLWEVRVCDEPLFIVTPVNSILSKYAEKYLVTKTFESIELIAGSVLLQELSLLTFEDEMYLAFVQTGPEKEYNVILSGHGGISRALCQSQELATSLARFCETNSLDINVSQGEVH